ncbi:hypothetical protein BAE44_0006555 [Dichanthelium oligosanthes]|uniref:FBD domain-containing protein n=1 Tax=Dichanthelium oligosanthes TaxID=888268 RepID=A0A1E5W4T5_9POAL|nr:hypothetical protein BAE44_0006555 [Dichanthelium oligosanthes]
MDALLAAPASSSRGPTSTCCPRAASRASASGCWSSGCTLGPPGGAASFFGRLTTLKMVSCNSSPETLQAMLAAAPSLARLWLEGVRFTGDESKRRVLLRCPDATVSVTVMHCHRTAGLDVDAPSARSLRYTGFLEHFPFSSATPSGPPVNLQRVQLSLCTARWFSRLQDLKLELLDINDIAVRSEEEGGMLFKAFPELKFLELEGSHEVDSHGAAAAIANLLLSAAWHCRNFT